MPTRQSSSPTAPTLTAPEHRRKRRGWLATLIFAILFFAIALLLIYLLVVIWGVAQQGVAVSPSSGAAGGWSDALGYPLTLAPAQNPPWMNATLAVGLLVLFGACVAVARRPAVSPNPLPPSLGGKGLYGEGTAVGASHASPAAPPTTTSRPTDSPLPSGEGSVVRSPRIFVSHSSADNDFGVGLARDLRDRLGCDVFYDSDGGPTNDRSGGLLGGDDWQTRIERELTDRDVFVVILSPAALASQWVRLEARTAFAQAVSVAGKVFIPVLHQEPDEVEVPPFLARYQWVSFVGTRDRAAALDELISAVTLGRSRLRQDTDASLERLGPPFELGALPATDHFVGRGDDLAWVLDHLAPAQGAALASIAAANGFPGIGKSTLASRAVQRLFAEDRFPDGIAVVICKGLTDPTTILRRVLARFDPLSREPDARDPAELGRLAAALFAGKRALVVLDNVEPGWSVQQVVGPLRAAGVALLLTSRTELPTSAVPPEASRMLNLLTPDQALELFAEYYGRNAALDLTPPEQVNARRIVTALGYHTLAVKLAATYALRRKRPLDTLAREYETNPRLAQGLKDGDEAVGVLLDSSYGALPGDAKVDARRLFAALAAFPTADVGRNAILAVGETLGLAGVRGALDAIEDLRLADPGLEEALAETRADSERVRLHPLVASYVGTVFESDAWSDEQRNAAREAVAAYYADYANATDDSGRELDEDNIAGAINLAAALGDDLRVARIVNGMTNYWRDHSRTGAREQYLPLGLEAARRTATANGSSSGDQLRLANMLFSVTELQRQLGNLDMAEKYAAESLEVCRKAEIPREEGVGLSKLGDIARQRGELDVAQERYEQYLAIMREVKDRQGEGVALSLLGDIALRRGELDVAQERYEEALAISMEVKDRRAQGVRISKLGDIAMQRGALDVAQERYKQVLAIMREVKDRQGEGVALSLLGHVAWANGLEDEASEYYRQSLEISLEVKDPQNEGVLLAQLGRIAHDQGHFDDAERYFRQCLTVLQSVQDANNEARIALILGEFLIQQRDQGEEGCALLQRAIRIRERSGLAGVEEARETARRLGCEA